MHEQQSKVVENEFPPGTSNKLMKIRTDIRTNNFDQQVIQVEFVVIHYTACGIARTLDILCDEARKVSAHLVIDLDGTVFELIPCLNEPPLRGWHSGKSHWTDKSNKEWSAFNDFSIGIELVNENGNVFPFTEAQYQSLEAVLTKLRDTHPALKSPERIIGHEQIAGFRGKSDPGREFDWTRLLKPIYPDQVLPEYQTKLSAELVSAFQKIALHAPHEQAARDIFFSKLSELIESL